MSLIKCVFFILFCLFISSSLVFAQNKQTIESLTSSKNSKDVSSKLSQPKSVPAPVKKTRRSSNPHSVGLGVGQTVLLGDFNDSGVDGVTCDFFYYYSASHSFDMAINVHYSKHKYKQTSIQLSSINIGIKARLFNFDAFSPFVLAGLGFYRPEVRRYVDDQLKNSNSDITFGYHIGAGVDLKLNKHFTIGILGHAHDPFDVKPEVGSEIEGLYFKLLITGSYTF